MANSGRGRNRGRRGGTGGRGGRGLYTASQLAVDRPDYPPDDGGLPSAGGLGGGFGSRPFGGAGAGAGAVAPPPPAAAAMPFASVAARGLPAGPDDFGPRGVAHVQGTGDPNRVAHRGYWASDQFKTGDNPNPRLRRALDVEVHDEGFGQRLGEYAQLSPNDPTVNRTRNLAQRLSYCKELEIAYGNKHNEVLELVNMISHIHALINGFQGDIDRRLALLIHLIERLSAAHNFDEQDRQNLDNLIAEQTELREMAGNMTHTILETIEAAGNPVPPPPISPGGIQRIDQIRGQRMRPRGGIYQQATPIGRPMMGASPTAVRRASMAPTSVLPPAVRQAVPPPRAVGAPARVAMGGSTLLSPVAEVAASSAAPQGVRSATRSASAPQRNPNARTVSTTQSGGRRMSKTRGGGYTNKSKTRR